MIKSYKSLFGVTIVFALFATISFLLKIDYLASIAFWGIFVYLIVVCNKKSILRITTIEMVGVKEKIVITIGEGKGGCIEGFLKNNICDNEITNYKMFIFDLIYGE